MYFHVNTAGHVLDDQQIHFVWYKRDFESRELVLSDARVKFFLPVIFTMFRNIQDQFQHAMESDTMDPRVMEGDVHLPEDETKCNRKFTQMSISVAGYPSMEMVSYPVSDDWIEDTEKETCSKYYRLCMKALGLNKVSQGHDVNGNL